MANLQVYALCYQRVNTLGVAEGTKFIWHEAAYSLSDAVEQLVRRPDTGPLGSRVFRGPARLTGFEYDDVADYKHVAKVVGGKQHG